MEEVSLKLAWLNFACARGELDSCANLLAELKVLLTNFPSLPPSFEKTSNAVTELKTATNGIIPPSPDEYPMLGLNLLRLLAQNRIAEFHVELEVLSLEALDHPCIKYVLDLERSFMEGTYNRLFNACQTIPHEACDFFMDLLAETGWFNMSGKSTIVQSFFTWQNPDLLSYPRFSKSRKLSYAKELEQIV
ncbi:hypothetical protein E2562_033913 [Oryza meyeriana var. granulata]|uniref:CSN8/PSMD8/EIF3K domain-containing protein n=1 Tax=Oryza meyeriana var. granulata TaxID=110450 RepID=A0A6G1C390_9ORYZ|nr:hypothetical protein E2562_033913 [Oryza meyeriana var. granulata]